MIKLARTACLFVAASACATGGKTEPVATARMPAVAAAPVSAEPAAPPAPAAATRPSAPPLLTPAALDALVDDLQRAAGVTPAPLADDAELLRRATLDVIGRVPTLDEAERFLADRGADRRTRLVEALLASPEYAEHGADVDVDLFIGRTYRKPGLERRLDPRAYFVAALRENRPYDRMAREMLTFTGEMNPGGPGVFLASHLKGGGPEVLASATARLFLGVQIQCAQCHDHPYDPRYKQEDFYGLVAYFVRTRAREERIAGKAGSGAAPPAAAPTATATMTTAAAGSGAADPEGDVTGAGPTMDSSADMARGKKGDAFNKRFFVIDKPKGQAKMKKEGAAAEVTVRPRFLGRDVPPEGSETPRETAARAVVGSDLFAKTVVNRVWATLLGRGLVDPWDDLGGERDAHHPPLLDRLADDFRAGGYDRKRLLRLVLLSRAYGATSRGPAAAAAAAGGAVPARAVPRRLTPEQLFRSLQVATGADRDDTREAEEARRKIERLLREYRFVFGDDEMAEVNALAGNIPQALLLLNGEVTNRGVKARPDSTLGRILATSAAPDERLRRIFLAAYARPPTEAERARLLPPLASGAGPAPYEDLFFALLTSTEMLTNH